MAVYRVERTQGYTVMSNYHLKDTALSLKAKGLLSMFPLWAIDSLKTSDTSSTRPELESCYPAIGDTTEMTQDTMATT